ncbi:hypothetical protein, partial [Mycobacterium persicum]|uniref:hypothetical protein n=1 Tax=Mycobacterium persicum TaxID=1487726 RepID=UPI001C611D5C
WRRIAMPAARWSHMTQLILLRSTNIVVGHRIPLACYPIPVRGITLGGVASGGAAACHEPDPASQYIRAN